MKGLLEQSRRYNPLDYDDIADAIAYIVSDGRFVNFKNGVPTHAYISKLLKKYDLVINFKRISNIPEKRVAAGQDLEGIEKWYEEVDKLLDDICCENGITRSHLTSEYFAILDETCCNPGILFPLQYNYMNYKYYPLFVGAGKNSKKTANAK